MTSVRLTRNLMNRIFGGVCGGISSYLGISAWWVRAVFVVLTLTNWSIGLLIYLFFWMLMPSQTLRDLPPIVERGPKRTLRYPRAESLIVLGFATVLVGVLVLVQSAGTFLAPQGDLLAPGLLFLNGFVLFVKHLRGQA